MKSLQNTQLLIFRGYLLSTSANRILIVMAAGCLVSLLGFGVRSTFGLFLDPVTDHHGWSRSDFALAIAMQNLAWGVLVPVAGALADRFGIVRVMSLGAVFGALGTWTMSVAPTPLTFQLAAGVLSGTGVAFTAFSIVIATMAKVVGPARQSMALGLGTAAGSLGQVIFSPLTQLWIDQYGWDTSLVLLAFSTLLIIPMVLVMGDTRDAPDPAGNRGSLPQAMRTAISHRGYVLLTAGFFVCGFHVAFIGVHFPAYVTGLGFAGSVGATALALIGLFNIAGSVLSGIAGSRFSKRSSLSVIYALRAVAIAALMLAPQSEITIYLFAGTMGLLWLSTVPLTTGIVAQIFGTRYLATLSGIVFFGHQLGSFSGVWLGGFLHDRTGSYEAVWWTGVGLSVFATVLHMAIDERPLEASTGIQGHATQA